MRRIFLVALFAAVVGCRSSGGGGRGDPLIQEPIAEVVQITSASCTVFYGDSLAQHPDLRAAFTKTIGAWASSYPIPGLRVYVFRYPVQAGGGAVATSWRILGEALIHLSWGGPAPGVQDPSWEIPHEFYGLDDPPQVPQPGGRAATGPTTLPPDDAARRARAVALGG